MVLRDGLEASDFRSPEPNGHMPRAVLRFYAELNDFLAPAERQQVIVRSCAPRTSIKDLIEGIGVPHTEIDLLLVNGAPVDFDYRVQDDDRISVYPVFESLDIGNVTRVRPVPLRTLRFAVDQHLGRLAAYLRLAGFDAWHRNDADDDTLATLEAGGRVLLTRDQGLLKRRSVTRGYWVRSTAPKAQLVEVLRRFDLAGSVQPFRRCLRCNILLEPAQKSEVAPALPPRVRDANDEFMRCPECARLYWRGTHFDALRNVLESALSEVEKLKSGTVEK